jgi:hypothetical protein
LCEIFQILPPGFLLLEQFGMLLLHLRSLLLVNTGMLSQQGAAEKR